MSDSSDVATPALPLDEGVVKRLVQEELDRKDKYIEFAQSQMTQDRAFYKFLYACAAAAITLIVIMGGIFGYKSVDDMRADMKASTALAEARVNERLNSIDADVEKKIDKEFRAENISTLIESAAKERTEKEITETIRSEIAAQVASGITQEQPIIQKAVEDQTKEVVKALAPTIKTSIEAATQNEVKTSVTPIQTQMTAYGDVIRIGNLVTLARGDDRAAFDYLLQIENGTKPESANPDLFKLADAGILAIVMEKKFGFQFQHTSLQKVISPEDLLKLMSSPSILDRLGSIENYPQDDKKILPTLIPIIKSDPSIYVLYAAVQRFNQLTKQSFDFWKTNDLLDWWEKNKTTFQ